MSRCTPRLIARFGIIRPLITAAITLTLSGAAPPEAGTASGLAQTGQQLGGAFGPTLLAAATDSATPRAAGGAYGGALTAAAAVVLIGAVVIAIRTRRA